MKSAPMTFGACYDCNVHIATGGGYGVDLAGTDRGNGVWQSKWRERQLGLGRPGRYRLLAEVPLDEGSTQAGWTVRFVVEQQKVKDLRKSMDPKEEDWSDDGQDRERETLFGEQLVRGLNPKQP
jgi:hypothetical protein